MEANDLTGLGIREIKGTIWFNQRISAHKID